MKKLLLFGCVVLFHFAGFSQIFDGSPMDSLTIRFSGPSIPYLIPDTASTPLWQIGYSHKAFFGTSATAKRIMTDTVNHYPVNANNWFVIKVRYGWNAIVDFWHKYQTDSARDGGMVEFSLDHGASWQNIKGSCNSDSFYFATGVRTENFYSFADTVRGGHPAFSGTKGSEQYSRFQFFEGFAVGPHRTTVPCFLYVDTIYVRFRFISDSTADTLAGWVIDSAKVEYDFYPGSVATVNDNRILKAYPNPSSSGIFNFPPLDNEDGYRMELYNTVGERLSDTRYKETLDISNYPPGLYFFRVSDGTVNYYGKLLRE